jgi:cobalt-zinc-cadmium efflux system membrane fusion protein
MAPRRGAVVDIDVYANQEVAPGRDKPLVQISDLEEVLVLADVAENDSADVQQGAEVEIRAQGGTVVRQGKVEHVSEVVDPQRRAVEVRIRVANGDRALRPNSLVEILFSPPAAALRVRVPSSAVVTDGEKSVVFVAKSPSRLERVPVTLGRQRDGEVELLAGLAPGTRYVSSGALLLLNEVELAD